MKSINLNHAYRCTYSVGSYSSYSNWMGSLNGGDDLGFIRDVLNGSPTPSSPYDISSVSITESFSPLIGVDATLKNNMSIHGEYKDTRTVALNISSNQLVETLANEFILGLGYKIADFQLFEPTGKDKSNFKSDLNVRGDISYRLNQALIRKIEESFTQPTSGTSNITVKLSADYAFSKALTLRAYFDKQINKTVGFILNLSGIQYQLRNKYALYINPINSGSFYKRRNCSTERFRRFFYPVIQ